MVYYYDELRRDVHGASPHSTGPAPGNALRTRGSCRYARSMRRDAVSLALALSVWLSPEGPEVEICNVYVRDEVQKRQPNGAVPWVWSFGQHPKFWMRRGSWSEQGESSVSRQGQISSRVKRR